MKYAGIIPNDFVNGEGVSVTIFVQGCPHHCDGCHNPETWDFEGGIESSQQDLIDEVISLISKNGIIRNLSISGGEPLCEQNIDFVYELIDQVRFQYYRNIKICCWTGYEYDELKARKNPVLDMLLYKIDTLITGPFIKEQRDITLKLRGSRNQQIWRRDINNKLVLSNE